MWQIFLPKIGRFFYRRLSFGHLFNMTHFSVTVAGVAAAQT